MKIYIHLIIALLGMAFFVSCTKETKPTHAVRFFPETESSGASFSKSVRMPLSRLEFIVTRKPVIWEAQIADVQMVQVASGEYALRFIFDDYGTRELYRQSVQNLGRRMVVEINGKAMGARQFDGAISNGVYYTFMEMKPDEMAELVVALQKNIELVQKSGESKRFLR